MHDECRPRCARHCNFASRLLSYRSKRWRYTTSSGRKTRWRAPRHRNSTAGAHPGENSRLTPPTGVPTHQIQIWTPSRNVDEIATDSDAKYTGGSHKSLCKIGEPG